MPSYAKPIADAVVTILSGLPGAPTLVKFRKADVLHPRDPKTAMIVTAGLDRPAGRAFGGVVFKEYGYQVAVYRECLGDVTSNPDTNPSLVLAAKQALDLPALPGVSVPNTVELVESSEWEPVEFKNGIEKSVFGVMVRTSEPQNG